MVTLVQSRRLVLDAAVSFSRAFPLRTSSFLCSINNCLFLEKMSKKYIKKFRNECLNDDEYRNWLQGLRVIIQNASVNIVNVFIMQNSVTLIERANVVKKVTLLLLLLLNY